MWLRQTSSILKYTAFAYGSYVPTFDQDVGLLKEWHQDRAKDSCMPMTIVLFCSFSSLSSFLPVPIIKLLIAGWIVLISLMLWRKLEMRMWEVGREEEEWEGNISKGISSHEGGMASDLNWEASQSTFWFQITGHLSAKAKLSYLTCVSFLFLPHFFCCCFIHPSVRLRVCPPPYPLRQTWKMKLTSCVYKGTLYLPAKHTMKVPTVVTVNSKNPLNGFPTAGFSVPAWFHNYISPPPLHTVCWCRVL